MRLFPRSARPYVDSSGVVAWQQLSHYVRATVLVAAVDAVGITVGALILRVPFAIAIGVLVFLLSFIPIVGALLSGAVAVLLALVAHGPVTALIMLAVVIAVQQLEAHVLQPFILGCSVRVHPVAGIAAIATGAILAGIVGTLVAVPVLAVGKAVANHPPRPTTTTTASSTTRRSRTSTRSATRPWRPASRPPDDGANRRALGSGRLAAADVDQPADPVAVRELAELVTPHLLLERRAHGGALGEALPVAAHRLGVSPLMLTVMLDCVAGGL